MTAPYSRTAAESLAADVNTIAAFLARRDVPSLDPHTAAADVLILCGSALLGAAEVAAGGIAAGAPPRLLITGGVGHSTGLLHAAVAAHAGCAAASVGVGAVAAEAHVLRAVVTALGVPPDALSSPRSFPTRERHSRTRRPPSPRCALRTAERHADVEVASAPAGRSLLSVRMSTCGRSCTSARTSPSSMRCSSASVAVTQFHRRDAGVASLPTEVAKSTATTRPAAARGLSSAADAMSPSRRSRAASHCAASGTQPASEYSSAVGPA